MKKILKRRKKLRPIRCCLGTRKGCSHTLMKRSKRGYPQAQRNRLADKTTKQAAEGLGVTSEVPIKAIILVELPELTPDSPE